MKTALLESLKKEFLTKREDKDNKKNKNSKFLLQKRKN